MKCENVNVKISGVLLTKKAGVALPLHSSYLCPQCLEAFIDGFVAAVDLVDIVDNAFPFGGEGGDQQGDAGTDIGRAHFDAAQLMAGGCCGGRRPASAYPGRAAAAGR